MTGKTRWIFHVDSPVKMLLPYAINKSKRKVSPLEIDREDRPIQLFTNSSFINVEMHGAKARVSPARNPFVLFLYHDDVPSRTTTTASEGPLTFSNLSLADDTAILINLSRSQSTRSLAPPLPSFTKGALHVHTALAFHRSR